MNTYHASVSSWLDSGRVYLMLVYYSEVAGCGSTDLSTAALLLCCCESIYTCKAVGHV